MKALRIFSRRLALGCLVLSASASALTESEWIVLGDTDAALWEGRAHSRVLGKNNSGDDIYKAMGRSTDKKSHAVEFEQWYVKVSDCRRGVGKLITTDMDGNFKYENDFVFQGGTIASSLAEMLCSDTIQDKSKGIPA